MNTPATDYVYQGYDIVHRGGGLYGVLAGGPFAGTAAECEGRVDAWLLDLEQWAADEAREAARRAELEPHPNAGNPTWA